MKNSEKCSSTLREFSPSYGGP